MIDVNVSKYLMGNLNDGENPFSLMIVKVDKINLADVSDRQKMYLARVLNPDVNAPSKQVNDKGELWVRITKKENKNVKLPVLNHGDSCNV